MRKQLIDLYNKLNDTVPKYEMSRAGYISPKDNVNEECKKLFEHVSSMKTLNVKANRNGVDVIQDTDIKVFKSTAFGPYIDSRYGKLVVPARVNFF